MIDSGNTQAAEATLIPENHGRPGRRWWIAALWALVSSPTAFLYVGLAGWAYAGYIVAGTWIIFCLTAGFTARLYSLLAVAGISLVYSALPVLIALSRRERYRMTKYNDFRWYLGSLVLWLALMGFIHLTSERTIGLKNYTIPSSSMANTLLPGDYILVDTRAYDQPGPQRNDLVVFRSPKDRKTIMIKRVAGVPGDTLTMKYKLLYLNGKMTNPPRTATYTDPDRIFPAEMSPRDNFAPIVLQTDEYFMLGDNRDNSRDSRFWGPVPREMMIGQAKFVYYSREGLITRLERIGLRPD